MNTTKRVLVVEDNPAMANLIRFNLVQAGLDAVVAKNGRVAWDRLQEESFDLLISDYQMPEMDGRQLCLKVRELPSCAGVPVILLTAKELELDMTTALEELKVSRVFPKPFSPSNLVEEVLQLLEPSSP